MKWASRVTLFTMGAVLAAAGARPVAASPVVRWRAPHTGVTSPDGTASVSESACGIEAFLAILANPAGAGIDEATASYQMTNLNALKALSLGGLGGVGEITAAEMDVLGGVKLALGDLLDTQDAMLVEAQAAQDLISALLGVPLVGIDALAAIDTLADSVDLQSLLAALLSSDLPIDVTIGQAELAAATESQDDGTVSFASDLGGGGGAWYGGHIANFGNGPGNGNGGTAKSYGGSAGGGGGGSGGTSAKPHHAHHHALRADAAVAVPLPAGAWAGLVLMTILAAGLKLRGVRVAI